MNEADTAANEPSAPSTFIYPGIVPPEEGHPTFANFEIVSTGDERGRALRAKTPFRPGERVARLSGVLITCAIPRPLPRLSRRPGNNLVEGFHNAVERCDVLRLRTNRGNTDMRSLGRGWVLCLQFGRR